MRQSRNEGDSKKLLNSLNLSGRREYKVDNMLTSRPSRGRGSVSVKSKNLSHMHHSTTVTQNVTQNAVCPPDCDNLMRHELPPDQILKLPSLSLHMKADNFASDQLTGHVVHTVHCTHSCDLR